MRQLSTKDQNDTDINNSYITKSDMIRVLTNITKMSKVLLVYLYQQIDNFNIKHHKENMITHCTSKCV